MQGWGQQVLHWGGMQSWGLGDLAGVHSDVLTAYDVRLRIDAGAWLLKQGAVVVRKAGSRGI